MERYSKIAFGAAVDGAGAPTGQVYFLAGATVTVLDSLGATAAIYSTNGPAPTAKANPFTTEADGEYSFYAANGAYTITISKTGFIAEAADTITLNDPNDVWPTATLPLADSDKVTVLQGTDTKQAAVATVRDAISGPAVAARDAAALSAAAAAQSAIEAAQTVEGGSFAQMMALPTPENGDAFLVTSGVGTRAMWWFYDAVRADWYPLENRILLAGGVGASFSAPIASLLGTAGAGARLHYVEIPANILKPGCEVRFWATITRSGNTLTSIPLVQIRLGTSNSVSDKSGGSQAWTATASAAVLQAIRPLMQFFVQSATSFFGGMNIGLGSSSGTTPPTEWSTNFDITQPMFLSWYTGGTLDPAETYALHAYSVEIFYGV